MVDILNPNCSESVMRVRTDTLTKQERDLIYKYLDILTDDEENYSSDDRKYDWWYDTGWEDICFGGIEWIEIRGETPFNYWDELENYLRKLPFIEKSEIG